MVKRKRGEEDKREVPNDQAQMSNQVPMTQYQSYTSEFKHWDLVIHLAFWF